MLSDFSGNKYQHITQELEGWLTIKKKKKNPERFLQFLRWRHIRGGENGSWSNKLIARCVEPVADLLLWLDTIYALFLNNGCFPRMTMNFYTHVSFVFAKTLIQWKIINVLGNPASIYKGKKKITIFAELPPPPPRKMLIQIVKTTWNEKKNRTFE